METVRARDLVKHKYYTVCIYKGEHNDKNDSIYDKCKYIGASDKKLHFKYWNDCRYVYLDIYKVSDDFIIYQTDQPQINYIGQQRKIYV